MSYTVVPEVVAEACSELRQTLQADGADIEVVGVENSQAVVRLILRPDACLECIVPKGVLERILQTAIQEKAPEIKDVVLEDPRLHDG